MVTFCKIAGFLGGADGGNITGGYRKRCVFEEAEEESLKLPPIPIPETLGV